MAESAFAGWPAWALWALLIGMPLVCLWGFVMPCSGWGFGSSGGSSDGGWGFGSFGDSGGGDCGGSDGGSCGGA